MFVQTNTVEHPNKEVLYILQFMGIPLLESIAPYITEQLYVYYMCDLCSLGLMPIHLIINFTLNL